MAERSQRHSRRLYHLWRCLHASLSAAATVSAGPSSLSAFIAELLDGDIRCPVLPYHRSARLMRD